MTPSIDATEARKVRRRVLQGMGALLALPSVSSLAGNAGGARQWTSYRRISPRLARARTASMPSTGAVGFTEDEARMIGRLAEAILPSDGTPGAKETGSGAFVVQSLQAESPEIVGGIKQALAALDGLAVARFGARFNQLPQAAVNALADVLSREPAFAPFWNGVRSLTVFHHYAMPAGYRSIGLPGPNIDRGGFPRPGLVPCPPPG